MKILLFLLMPNWIFCQSTDTDLAGRALITAVNRHQFTQEIHCIAYIANKYLRWESVQPNSVIIMNFADQVVHDDVLSLIVKTLMEKFHHDMSIVVKCATSKQRIRRRQRHRRASSYLAVIVETNEVEMIIRWRQCFSFQLFNFSTHFIFF